MKILHALLAFLLTLTASAQFPGMKSHAKFRLISENKTVAPGSTTALLLEMDINAGWHSYWENPNLKTNTPPSVKWTLPEGFTAGDLQFPFPVAYTDDTHTLFVNEGKVRFLVHITVPKNAQSGQIKLQGSVNAIICSDQNCSPAFEDVVAEFTVSSETTPDPAQTGLFTEARAAIPVSMDGVKADVSDRDGALTLRVEGLPADLKTDKLRFFPLNAAVDPVARQSFTMENGQLIMKGKINSADVIGVLVSQEPVFEGSHAVKIPLKGSQKPDTSETVSNSETVSGAFTWTTLLNAFLGGVLLNIMPCVFPVLGLKIMGFVQQSGNDRKKIIAHGLSYTIGVIIFFLILGAIILSVRKGGENTTFGEFFQDPRFNFLMACILIVLGMSFLGVFDFGLSLTGVGGKLQYLSGYAGSFFTGFLTVILATPCAGYLLGYTLAVAFAVTYAQAMTIFLCIAIGIAAPYLLLSMFPQMVKFLPKPGRWMELSKQFFGILMLGAVLWLGWVISTQIDETSDMLWIWLSLMVVAIAVWVYGIATEPGRKTAGKRVGLVLAGLIFTAGITYGFPTDKPHLQWETWSPETEARLIADKKPVYVDYTASWCTQCLTNKHVYKSEEIQALFKRKGVIALRADWSKQNPDIGTALNKLERGAIPVNVVYYPDDPTPFILSPLLTKGEIRSALEKLPDQ